MCAQEHIPLHGLHRISRYFKVRNCLLEAFNHIMVAEECRAIALRQAKKALKTIQLLVHIR